MREKKEMIKDIREKYRRC